MAPQVVLTLGLALDPAAVSAIQSQLSALGGGGPAGGNSSLNNVKLQLAQMQAASKQALLTQQGNQQLVLQGQKATDAQVLAGQKATLGQAAQASKAAAAQQLLQQKVDGQQQILTNRGIMQQTVQDRRFANQQDLLSQRQAGQQALLTQKQNFAEQQRLAKQQQNELDGFRLSRKFQGAATILDTLGLPGGRALSTAGATVQAFGGSISPLAAAGVGFGAVAISNVTALAKESLAKYSEVQDKIKLLQALTGNPRDPNSANIAAGFQNQGRQLSLGTGQSQAELAAASYFISSSGFTGKQGQQVLSAASLASQAGLGDVVKFADLLTSSLSAYGLTAEHATEITDIFTATVREGKAEPDQLAKSLGLVLPVAAAAGVRMDEVGAAIATITRTGSSAPQAVTQLKQTLSTLIKPSAQARDALASIGIEADQLVPRLKKEGLGTVLQDINEKASATGNRETVLSEIFGNIRAFTGVLSLSRSEFDAYNSILESTRNAQGDTAAAAEVMATTISQQAARIQSAFDGIEITLGEKFAASAQGVAGEVESLLLRINDALGGDIGDPAKKRVFNTSNRAVDNGNLVGGGGTDDKLRNIFTSANGGSQLLAKLLAPQINQAIYGVRTLNTGFNLFNPTTIPSDQLGAQRLAAEKELIKVEKDIADNPLRASLGLDAPQKDDRERLMQYVKDLTHQLIPETGTALPGGSSRVLGEYTEPNLPRVPAGPPSPPPSPSIFGESLTPEEIGKRNDIIIKASTNQVKSILGTADSFEGAFKDTKDAFSSVEKLQKLGDAQIKYSYTVVGGKRVEGESIVKAGKAYGQYQDALDRVQKAENSLAKAQGAKKPNALTISTAEINLRNAQRDLNQFNRAKPDAQLITSFNPDGTVKEAGGTGEPAKIITGTRRRGLTKKEQKELDDAKLKVEAFGQFVDKSFENRAVDGFDIALQHLATTNKDGVAPALAQTTLELENYLGATGKAKTTSYTLSLGLQALDNDLAGGKINFADYTKKLTDLQKGIKDLAPQITGAAPLTIEQAVEFKLVPKGAGGLIKDDKAFKQAKDVAFGLGDQRAFKTPEQVTEITANVKAAQDFKAGKTGSSGGVIQGLLASQGIDVTKGLETTIDVSLQAGGVDPKAINASIVKARQDVIDEAEKPLEPKPPVVLAAGQTTDNITGPISGLIGAIVAGLAGARMVNVPILLTTTITGDGGAGVGGLPGAGIPYGPPGSPLPHGSPAPKKPAPKTQPPPGIIPKRASGGRLAGRHAAIVGENGQELFVPDTDGYIVNSGNTADLLRQLGRVGYTVDDAHSAAMLPPPLTLKQLSDIAGLYPNTDIGKYYKKNKENALFYLNGNPQLTEPTLQQIGGSLPGSAAGVYLSLKAKYDELVRQRDTPGFWRNDEAIKSLNDKISDLALGAKGARQAASAQFYDPITGQKGNPVQTFVEKNSPKNNPLYGGNITQNTQAAFAQIHQDLMAVVVTGANGGGLSQPIKPYRPADPLPVRPRRPGGPAIPFAAGGLYTGGTLARVGELGPELFMSDTSGTFINAANTSRLASGRYMDNASPNYTQNNNNQQTFVIDARGSSNPQAVKTAAERGAYMGARSAKRSAERAIGRI